MKFIDSHAHYLSFKFNKDRDELLNKLFKEDLELIIECGTNSFYNKKTLELCHKHENMYGTIGFFPTDISELKNSKTWETFKNQLSDKKILGIGEIGLDYHHSYETRNEQAEYFIKQLQLAKDLNLPVCIHSREAEKDTMKILRDFGKMNGVIHCYAYGTKSMEELLELGYYFGVGGTSTYKNNTELRNAIKNMPLDRIFLETDAPYLTPAAEKRERNDSSKIKHVIKEISYLKGIPEEEIIKQTNKNVKKLYWKLAEKS